MWKKLLALLLFVIATAPPAGAQREELQINLGQNPPLYAIAHLGIARYGQVARDSHPKQFAAVVFTNTFGDASAIIKGKSAREKLWVSLHFKLYSMNGTLPVSSNPFISS